MGILTKIFKGKLSVRAHRFEVKSIHNLSMAIDGLRYTITNISMSGIGLASKELASICRVNDEILITLKVNDSIFNVSARIVRINNGFLGLAVTSHLSVYEANVKKYFESEISALKLQEKDASIFNEDYMGELTWLYSDDSHELLYGISDDNLLFFKINFQGVIYQKLEQRPLEVFQTLLPAHEQQSRLAKSVDLVPLNEEKPEMFEFVIRFVDAIQALNPLIKDEIIEILQQH